MGGVGHKGSETLSVEQDKSLSSHKHSESGPVNHELQQASFWAQSPDTSVHHAFASFWKKMDDMEKLNIEAEFREMKEKNAEFQAKQDEMLASISGVHLSVLDFVERGGLPPSVESLTAWLEIRDIDTSLWGQGEAKTVQEFFHELWAGECEPLTESAERVISVVKVRILDHDEAGTWQLYETKQKLCRDGRTRPRNRPLAEKRRPEESSFDAAVRGVKEELGSSIKSTSRIVVKEDSLQEWTERRMSKSFPGLETVYKLSQVDVEVEGLSRAATGDTFETEETPELSNGKVHTWTWIPSGTVDWSPVAVHE
ncbi:hypothetical protein GUITHDRAFT_121382 [Guillardia theta CCMP2712]|uniref:Nudix hydrolase domain-containing protein n=1 Tax=Guillardia theta (strain CCMP2712) TaxID=905079 RepID=L1I8P0_GUITC|nr:hypothetical protein GUITHDRAFT_121382 [Guillardia theta CCMP2712]EKX32452.1 hypothetical protein GUITHDRAFT_121382 [Guillardia theta CCMP2712]|eukprot:XP_005819432.1 hypothetical protein GUITHDRAFT_121382 [Guillardia theta CCMP2712]